MPQMRDSYLKLIFLLGNQGKINQSIRMTRRGSEHLFEPFASRRALIFFQADNAEIKQRVDM